MRMTVEKVSKACKHLIFSEPFYGLFLIGLNKKYRKDIPTAGVSKNNIGVELSINPDFVNTLPDKHIMGLMKHEVLHVAFGHLTIRDLFPDKKLFNIAADLEINQYIKPENLPEGGLTFDSFPDIQFPTRAGTREYYDILSQKRDEGSSETLENVLNQMNGESMYDHQTWEEFEDMSEAEKKLIEKQVNHQIKESAENVMKKQGTMPGELSEIISKLFNLEPAKFDWKGYLRRFVGNSTISYTKKLRRKFNKRYSGNPGLKIKFKNHILVGIDTSGSVNTKELEEFRNELVHMHKTGHKITVAQCDTSLNSVRDFNPKQDWEIHGRGGTSFQPVVDHFNEHGRYTALIYFTDGEAYSPDNCPKNTLWVLSSISKMNNELPGKVIQLN